MKEQLVKALDASLSSPYVRLTAEEPTCQPGERGLSRHPPLLTHPSLPSSPPSFTPRSRPCHPSVITERSIRVPVPLRSDLFHRGYGPRVFTVTPPPPQRHPPSAGPRRTAVSNRSSGRRELKRTRGGGLWKACCLSGDGGSRRSEAMGAPGEPRGVQFPKSQPCQGELG